MLSPRFYTTDFEELDSIDVSAVRNGMGRTDLPNCAAIRTRAISGARKPGTHSIINTLPEGLRKEFMDFLVSSLTAEFSGCVLYAEMRSAARTQTSSSSSNT